MLYQSHREKQELSAEQIELIHPARTCFVDVYRYIKQRANAGLFQGRVDGLYRKIRRDAKNPGISFTRMMVCLDVLEELKILNYQIKDNIITIHIFKIQGKIELGSSQILKQLAQVRQEVI
jgi:single-stranded-DNA-specific exonuclease